ncbi:chemotaxis-specific protein-glutamate methyltransferase CheB [Sulfurimonas sp.]|nr:chemotaxis-specific protein-glutamate methyltransferase CheB [Sulfurimonas sp.]
MIKVMVIDDSAVVRNAFKKMLSDIKDIKLISTAVNPIDAFSEFKKTGLPDVFILDIEMPKMDGLTFLKQINEQRPIPTIMCSTLLTSGSKAAIDALRMGAIGIMQKPTVQLGKYFDEYKDEFLDLIYAASKSKINFNMSISKTDIRKSILNKNTSKNIVAIGASTGGVQAIENIVKHLRPNHTPIIITQHIPVGFSKTFAQRLDSIVATSTIKEAEDNDKVINGRVLIAPGNLHMEIKKVGFDFVVRLKDFPKVNSHKPSVNVLFSSMAKEVGSRGVGFILTGMGDDGASKLKAMKDKGAKTYAQSESSCMVYGMPKEAVRIGAVDASISLHQMVNIINEL